MNTYLFFLRNGDIIEIKAVNLTVARATLTSSFFIDEDDVLYYDVNGRCA